MSNLLEKEFRLLLVMLQNKYLRIEQLCERTGLPPRTVYRYIDHFSQVGLKIRKERTLYSIDPSSPFLNSLTGRIHLTQEEAVFVRHLLDGVREQSPQLRSLKEKVASLTDQYILQPSEVDNLEAAKLHILYKAVKEHGVVKLCNYFSHHSGKTEDRLVEPFQFLANNTEIRAYEISSKKCKTYKISRAENVEAVNLKWSYEAFHEPTETDLFHFSGVAREEVQLILGLFAKNVLLEEYPSAKQFLSETSDHRHLLHARVCNFKGVGRFVLGLLDDIEVVGNDNFRKYLKDKLENLTLKV